jgi:hypothetical protein
MAQETDLKRAMDLDLEFIWLVVRVSLFFL